MTIKRNDEGEMTGRTVQARRYLRLFGAFLLIVAAIHLFIMSVLRKAVLTNILTPDTLRIVEPPFLLNHIVVGVLLIPMGLSPLYSAHGIGSGKQWAWFITIFNALSLLPLSAILLFVMRAEFFHAIPFLVRLRRTQR
ncbi:MAG: hypothetical protein ACE5NG_09930 [bacterium]